MNQSIYNVKEGTQTKAKYAGLQCLYTVAAYYGIAVDMDRVVYDLGLEGDKMTPQDILRASRKINLKSRLTKVNMYALRDMTVPALLITKEGDYIILAKASQENVLLLYPYEQAPRVLQYEELGNVWQGDIILLIPRVHKYREVKFGFRWFIPSILKYKSLLLEVLLAAFIIQILSICSPLVTQSVIDKVLVHNSLSTLDVLVLALGVMLVFETILSIARNYILVHTTSKIDVMLSSRLFEHLFRLPRQDCGNAVKSVLYGAKWGRFLHL